MGEKQPNVSRVVAQDDAVVYLDSHRAEIANVDLKALRRKIDWHILPLALCSYILQFLDKVALNVRVYFEYHSSGHHQPANTPVALDSMQP
jgi:hypothetical protein